MITATTTQSDALDIPVPTTINHILRGVYFIVLVALTSLSIAVLGTTTIPSVGIAAAVMLLGCILHIFALHAVRVNGRSGSMEHRGLLLIPVYICPLVVMPVLPLFWTAFQEYGIHLSQDEMAWVAIAFLAPSLLNVAAHRRWVLNKLGLER